MTIPHILLRRFFDNFVLERPGLVIFLLLAVVSFLGYQAKNFKLDASAETLVLENDEDLKYSRLINARYEQQDFLLISYTPGITGNSQDSFIDAVSIRGIRTQDSSRTPVHYCWLL